MTGTGIRERLSTVRLKGMECYNLSNVLNAFQFEKIPKENVLKRFLRIIKYSLISKVQVVGGKGDIAFLFSNNYANRKDHMVMFRKVVGLYTDPIVYIPGKKVSLNRLKHIGLVFCWHKALIQVFDLETTWVLLDYLYSFYLDADDILRDIAKRNICKLVVFCDMHPIDYMVVSQAKKQNVCTMTLQHGHYANNSPAFIHSLSDRFLGFGPYSRTLAIQSGMSANKFYCVGMMGLINEEINNNLILHTNHAFSIILSGVLQDDLNLLQLSELLVARGLKRYIKYHPGSKKDKYDYNYLEDDVLVFSDISVFDLMDMTDFSLISGGSTVYAEYIAKLFPAFLYDDSVIGYSGLETLRFSNIQGLDYLLNILEKSPNELENIFLRVRNQLTVSSNVGQCYCDAINF